MKAVKSGRVVSVWSVSDSGDGGSVGCGGL